MSWKTELREASFRGVKFNVTSQSKSGGRRNAKIEYPNRETPSVTDLGRAIQSYSVEAFVVGSDYLVQKRKLEKALDTEGSGVLVHPYYGELTVCVDSYEVSENNSDAGMAGFSIKFVEAGDIKYPDSTVTSESDVRTKSEQAVTNAANNMELNFTVKDVPAAVATTSSDAVKNIATSILNDTSNAYSTSSIISTITGNIDEMAQFVNDANKIINNAYILVTDPSKLAYRLTNVISSVPDVFEYVEDAFTAYVNMFGHLLSYFNVMSFSGSATGIATSTNMVALRDSVMSSIIAGASKSALDIEYETSQQAYNIRTSLVDMFDSLLAVIEDDTLYNSVESLKISTIKAVPPEGVRLEDVVVFHVNDTVPSLVLAYDIYGNLDYEEDIVTRNGIASPFLILGGSNIQVLK